MIEIKFSIVDKSKNIVSATYRDIESELDFKDKKIEGARVHCFHGDKLVIVYDVLKARWSAPGGGIEDGENVREGIVREVREETNMKVLKQRFVGLVEACWLEGTKYYSFSVALVEPAGKFHSDPAGEVTDIKEVTPNEIKRYFTSDETSERFLERALSVKHQWDAESK